MQSIYLSQLAPRGRFELPRAKMPTGSPGLRLTGLGYLGFGKK